MGETTDSIRRDIDRERHLLEENLEGIESKVQGATNQVQDKVEEVQNKVKEATDWRVQFDRRPMVGLAVAFGGGVLLTSMLGGGDKDRGGRSYYGSSYQPQYQSFNATGGADVGRQHMSSTFDNVKGALMGVAATQLKSVLSDALPGFADEYRQVERESGPGSSRTGRFNQTQTGSTSTPADYPVAATGHDQPSATNS